MKLYELKEHFTKELSAKYQALEIQTLFNIFSEEYLKLKTITIRQNPNLLVDNSNLVLFLNAISKLKSDIPYQYILGEAECYGMKFIVDENVLIPRPETEEMLEIGIHLIKKRFPYGHFKLLDIGTGSGLMALVMQKQFPNAKITGLDVSHTALEVAKKNAERHLLYSIDWLETDYLTYKPTELYDMILSNPPYIGIEESNELDPRVKRNEPDLALFSPSIEDPLVFYRKIASDLPFLLNKSGIILMEINQKYAKETATLFLNCTKNVHIIQDLSRNDRFVYCEY